MVVATFAASITTAVIGLELLVSDQYTAAEFAISNYENVQPEKDDRISIDKFVEGFADTSKLSLDCSIDDNSKEITIKLGDRRKSVISFTDVGAFLTEVKIDSEFGKDRPREEEKDIRS